MEPLHFACFYGILLAVLLVLVSAEGPVLFPHSTCENAEGLGLFCSAGNYSIPGNFDPILIPPTIELLELGGFRALPSYVHDDAEPLPNNLPNLTTVTLSRFEGTNSTRLPLEHFFVNVRAHLTDLMLTNCRINPLGADLLKGFTSLRDLTLLLNDIRDIDATAFETGIHLQASRPPVLLEILLESNYITSLDFAVFAPVAGSLQKLNIRDQRPYGAGLNNLTLSTSFKFTNLSRLQLGRNRLDFLSRSILDTLTISDKTVLELDNNAFCPTQKSLECACCEAEDFITWTHEIASGPITNRPTLSFTCGSGWNVASWNLSATRTNLPPVYLDQCCSNSSAPGCVDEQTTSSRPTPSNSGVTDSSVVKMTCVMLLPLLIL